jgi:hypothetical protein
MMKNFNLDYGTANDTAQFDSLKEETKLVDKLWLKNSHAQDLLENQGYSLRWSNKRTVAEKKLDGWETIFEFDVRNKTRRTNE